MMTTRNAAPVGATILILLLATGCSVAGQPQAASLPPSPRALMITTTEQQSTTVTAVTTVEVPSSEPVFSPPAGFDDWGNHVGAKWSDQTTFTCADSSDSCWGVDLYSERGCAGGILVVLDVFRDQTKLTVIDGTTAAVAPGARVTIVLGQTGNGTGLSARIATISCLDA
jgi:hypothetical protein